MSSSFDRLRIDASDALVPIEGAATSIVSEMWAMANRRLFDLQLFYLRRDEPGDWVKAREVAAIAQALGRIVEPYTSENFLHLSPRTHASADVVVLPWWESRRPR